ncbi:MAG TPA: hypothetical protein VER39_15005 [Nocardioidaceae bacterium]|nr:hypothetical protein [Nocardioidaceae bacterium]
MAKFKRTVASAAVAAALAAPLAVSAPAHAYAGTPGCVTVTEYRSITKGMSQLQVARRFGRYGAPYWGLVTWRLDSTFSKDIDREWRICNSAGKPRGYSYGSVSVSFVKESDLETGAFPPGPLLSTYKSRWSS